MTRLLGSLLLLCLLDARGADIPLEARKYQRLMIAAATAQFGLNAPLALLANSVVEVIAVVVALRVLSNVGRRALSRVRSRSRKE